MKSARVCPKLAVFMALLVVSLPVCFAVEMSLTYDANGNLVTGDGQYRTYNTLNQLWKVYNGSSTSGILLYEYTYHPVEERVLVKKMYNQSGGWVETDYYWSKNFVTVQNGSGYYNFTYVYHDGELVAQKNPDGTKLFFANDLKGSSSVVMNSSGNVVERTVYSPTGEIVSGGRLSKYGYEAKEQEQGFGDIPTNGLVSYFALENNALDDSGANNGMIINATRTNGKVKDAYYFDGNSDYVQVNDSSSLDLTSSITISAWVMPAKASQGYIAAKYGAYMIQYLGGTTNTTQGGIWIAGTWTTLATSAAIPLNQWTHVVFTYNKSNAVIYINGAQSGTGANTNSIDTNNQILCIGAKNATTHDRDFNGTIDEVGVWNRALSAGEVKALYDYGGLYSSGVRDVDFNARRYDPELGIFTQPDTLIKNVYDPQSLNRYMFERGNPYKNQDPTGHNWVAAANEAALEFVNELMGELVSRYIEEVEEEILTTAWEYTVGGVEKVQEYMWKRNNPGPTPYNPKPGTPPSEIHADTLMGPVKPTPQPTSSAPTQGTISPQPQYGRYSSGGGSPQVSADGKTISLSGGGRAGTFRCGASSCSVYQGTKAQRDAAQATSVKPKTTTTTKPK